MKKGEIEQELLVTKQYVSDLYKIKINLLETIKKQDAYIAAQKQEISNLKDELKMHTLRNQSKEEYTDESKRY